MFLAKVIGNLVSTIKHEAYGGKKLLVISPINPLNPGAEESPVVAVDYVGAGIGDLVMAGQGPGVAKEVFQLPRAPMETLIMAIVDRVDLAFNPPEARK